MNNMLFLLNILVPPLVWKEVVERCNSDVVGRILVGEQSQCQYKSHVLYFAVINNKTISFHVYMNDNKSLKHKGPNIIS